MRAEARETSAAFAALASYLTTVLPKVRRELRQLGPLPANKAKNAEAVAVFATLAPRPRRAAVVRAIVSLQVAIDLSDEFEESGEAKSSEVTARLDAMEARRRRALATLPSHEVVSSLLDRAINRCKQGQLHTHRAADEDPESLRRWAEGLGAPPEYRWWEVAAGAAPRDPRRRRRLLPQRPRHPDRLRQADPEPVTRRPGPGNESPRRFCQTNCEVSTRQYLNS